MAGLIEVAWLGIVRGHSGASVAVRDLRRGLPWRCRAGLLSASVCLACVFCAAMPAPSAAAGYSKIVDLGQGVVPTYDGDGNTGLAVVGGQYEVLVTNGLWINGAVSRPSAPASDPSATFDPVAINSAGVVVGSAATGAGSTVPAYWDSTRSSAFAEVSLSGATVAGAPASGGGFESVDAAGEAVGYVQSGSGIAGLFVPAVSGVPAGPAQTVTTSGLLTLYEVSAGYEAGVNNSGYVSIDRHTQAAVQTGLGPAEAFYAGFGDSGDIGAYQTQSTGYPEKAFLYQPGSATAALQSPAGTVPALASVNGSGQSVGYSYDYGASGGSPGDPNNPAEIWAADGSYAPLAADLPPNSGWTSLNPLSIDDQSDVAGSGTFNGHTHGFLLENNARPSATSVRCLPASSGTGTDTCTVTVSDKSGLSPTLTPTGSVALTASAGTFNAGSSCQLAGGAADLSASCAVSYSPPSGVGVRSPAPVVSVTYPGDSVFGSSVGSQTLDCLSGAIFELDSLTSAAPTTHGVQVGAPVTLHGCGFTAQTVVRFGADNATAKAAATTDVSTDATSLTVTVPIYAISGPMSMTDTTYATSRTATLSSPNPVQIDSWRNTQGFSFKNFGGTVTPEDLVYEFPTSKLAVSAVGPVLRPWAEDFLRLKASSASDGLCYGFALTSGEFTDGFLHLGLFDLSAQTPFELARTSTLTRYATQQWLGQYSDQWRPLRKQALDSTGGQTDIISRLSAVMGPAGGLDRPAIIGIYGKAPFGSTWEGHAEIAYGWGPSPISGDPAGSIAIYTADSNVPFTSGENADASGTAHAAALKDSWIRVQPSGGWTAPHENLSGPAKGLVVAPVSALQGLQTLSRASLRPRPASSISLSSDDRVQGLADSTGHPVSLARDSADVQIVPQITDSNTPSAATSAISGPGWSGIDQLLINHGQSTTELNGGNGPITALWQAAHVDADLSASSGHVSARFDPAGTAFAVTPVAHERAPRSATAMLTAKLDGDNTEHVVTLTGPAHVTVSLGAAVKIISRSNARYHVTLTTLRLGGTPQTADFGMVSLGRDETLSIHPQSWTRIATTRYTATVSAPGRPLGRLRLSNHAKAPVSTLVHLSRHSNVLRLTIRVPALLAGESSVSIAVRVRSHGRLLARGIGIARAGGAAHTTRVRIELSHPVPASSHVAVTIDTINGGDAPAGSISRFAPR